MRCCDRSSAVTGWNVPAPTCSVTYALATPARASAASAGLVEVQAGGGRGHRAGRARVDGLVARRVVGVPGARDVGRQRHCAVALEPVEELAGAVEVQQEEAVLACLDDRVRTTREVDAPARLRQVARPELGPRGIVADEPLDQHLDASARRLAAERPRVDHARVVEHREVPGTQQRRQVGEAAVVERLAVDVEQPARAPRARAAPARSARRAARSRSPTAGAARACGIGWPGDASAVASAPHRRREQLPRDAWCREGESNPHGIATGGF